MYEIDLAFSMHYQASVTVDEEALVEAREHGIDMDDDIAVATFLAEIGSIDPIKHGESRDEPVITSACLHRKAVTP
ncbi:hypothetical protein [Galactobacter valiniphilus]|uniref:hypothetical protein n=1 Tax=Galactobacter valiniphilus TaxID=2676122 RepID=UPI003734C908